MDFFGESAARKSVGVAVCFSDDVVGGLSGGLGEEGSREV